MSKLTSSKKSFENKFTFKILNYKSNIYIYIYIYIWDSAVNNLRRLMSHEIPTDQPTNKPINNLYCFCCVQIYGLLFFLNFIVLFSFIVTYRTGLPITSCKCVVWIISIFHRIITSSAILKDLWDHFKCFTIHRHTCQLHISQSFHIFLHVFMYPLVLPGLGSSVCRNGKSLYLTDERERKRERKRERERERQRQTDRHTERNRERETQRELK